MTKSMKKRLKKKANQSSNHNQNSANQKFNKKKININQELSISDKRLETYGLKPNQYKRKVRKQKYKEKSAKQ